MGLIVDLFAGGGGASLGIERALGRPVDIAINHDPEAVALHERNHPFTRHFVEDVWQVDPVEATGGQHVDLLWASPDCKHFSKARGGAPVSKRVRSLAWVVVKWAGKVRPDVILLENVEEFVTWGPLVMKRGPDGRPLRDDDGRPVMIPDPKRRGQIYRAWVKHLERHGYVVEARELVAADYGDPTTRRRFKLVARCDGRPIVWPEPSHADPQLPKDRRAGRRPWRTAAAAVIDWTIPCPSIFLTREEGRAAGVNRPLVPKTMARIARGVQRYVLDNPRPFIVPVTHGGDLRAHDSRQPVRTITTTRRGELAVVMPFLGSHYGPDGGRDRAAEAPVPAITTRGTQTQLVAPVLVPRYGERDGQAPRAREVTRPMPAIVPTANGAQLVAAFMAQHNTGMVGREATRPMATIVAGELGTTQALVAAQLSAAGGGRETIVAAFLQEYHATGGQHSKPSRPMPTVTAFERLAPVTVTLRGSTRTLVDIGMRMFTPRELYRAQGFPDSYVIDAGIGGRWLTKSAQIRMCGNSVCPGVAAALVAANAGHLRRSAEAAE